MKTESNLSPVYAVECGPEGCGVHLSSLFSKRSTTACQPATTYSREEAEELIAGWLSNNDGRPCRVVTIELSVRPSSKPTT